MSSFAQRIGVSLALVTTLIAVAGCGSGELRSVSEAAGSFHVRVPAEWQYQVGPGLMMFYASQDLPESEQESFETLSVGIYSASTEASGSVGDALTALLEARAEERQWKDEKIEAPKEVQVGNRPAYAADVRGTDSKGRRFAGRGVLVSTSGRQVLTFAVSPEKSWSDQQDAVDQLMQEWYWHVSDSAETTEDAGS